MNTTRPALGVGLMTVANFGFAGMAALVKLMDTHLPEQELVFWRAAFSLPLLLLLVLWSRRGLLVRARGTILLRSVLGFIAMMLFFYALGRISLGEAQMLIKIQPVWVALLAPFVLGERPGGRVWSCLGLAFVGVALVLGPSLTAGVLGLAGLAALGSSLFSALAHMQLRKLGRTDPPDLIVFNFTALLLLFSGVMTVPVARMPDPGHWPLLVGLAMCAMAGQMFMTAAYRAAPAPLVATVGYVAIPVAMFLDWQIWGTVPSGWSVCGGALIIASGIGLAQQRRAPEEPK